MAATKLIASLATGVAIAAAGIVSLAPAAIAGKEAATAKVGEPAPAFTLVDYTGAKHSLADLTADEKIVVLEWWNPGCPFVVKHHQLSTTMTDLAAKYADQDVVWMAINSGAEGNQGYGVDEEMAKKWNVEYPVLIDSDGTVGHMYDAKTTPHMFIIDAKGVLVYAGAIDSDRNPKPATDPSTVTNYVDQALTQLLAGETITVPETKPYGCSVKYAK